ncbi:MAG TPA: Ppx/GppA phosphatase family protein [Nitrolancea sp.]|nr:Ppx/GppA phosphatase family protein [Nitrolancea sp.]
MQPVRDLIDDLATGNVPKRRIGVVDLGSNSGRLVVYDQYAPSRLDIVEDARVPLRLAHDLHDDGSLDDEALERALDALRAFHAIAQGAGAERTIVVGTSAMRDATNGELLRARVEQEVGVDVEIIDGLAEARYSFLGAVHGLPVWNGFVLDIGGGSLELTHFRDRLGISSWMLPLGALRLSEQFLPSDPPTSKELRRLKQFIERRLTEEGIPKADKREVLVGTGGTIRNIAKINRKQRPSPIQRLHGCTVPFARVKRIASTLAGLDLARRASVPGLNADRADSIVGGVIAVQVVMGMLGATEILVSGEGLREGIAFSLTSSTPPDPDVVKQSSVAALASRFRAWEAGRAHQRVSAARQLAAALAPDLPESFQAALLQAAFLLDIGRSVDYYNRLSHSAAIVLLADLDGFTHREIALLAAIIREADKRQADLGAYAPLLSNDDSPDVARCGALLALADEIERRYPGDRPIELKIDTDDGRVQLSAPAFSDYERGKLAQRFGRTFGQALIFS